MWSAAEPRVWLIVSRSVAWVHSPWPLQSGQWRFTRYRPGRVGEIVLPHAHPEEDDLALLHQTRVAPVPGPSMTAKTPLLPGGSCP